MIQSDSLIGLNKLSSIWPNRETYFLLTNQIINWYHTQKIFKCECCDQAFLRRNTPELFTCMRSHMNVIYVDKGFLKTEARLITGGYFLE